MLLVRTSNEKKLEAGATAISSLYGKPSSKVVVIIIIIIVISCTSWLRGSGVHGGRKSVGLSKRLFSIKYLSLSSWL